YDMSDMMQYLSPLDGEGQANGSSVFFNRVPTIADYMPVTFDDPTYDTLEGARGTNGPFNQFVADPDVGQNPNLEFVTGTGANDIITIKRASSTTATVSVQPFSDIGFTQPIQIPGAPGTTTYKYTINLTKTILVDGGLGDNTYNIDPSLGVDVRVRGGG